MIISLLNPASSINIMGRHRSTMTAFPPLGLASIAAVLEQQGHQLMVIDQYAEGLSEIAVADRVAAAKPDLIGISCLTPAMATVERLAKLFRRSLPEVRLVLGNVHASVFAEDLLARGIGDFVVHGEGELTLSALAKVLEAGQNPDCVPGLSYWENGQLKSTGANDQLADLDQFPIPAWHLFPLDRYNAHPITGASGLILPVLASRGCPYTCSFCAQNVVFKGVRRRSPERVVDEIEYLQKAFNVKMVGMSDAIFPQSRKEGFAFCEEMIRRGLHRKVGWFTETRVELIDREMLALMKRAGLIMILYGIESGNRDILDKCEKKISLHKVRHALAITRESGIRCLGLFIIGLPGESALSARQTIRLALELDPDFAKFNLAVPYPGSKFFKEWWDGHDLKDEYHKFSSWYMPRRGERLLHVPKAMTQKSLLYYQHLAMVRFWLRPKKIAAHLRRQTIDPLTMAKGAYGLATSLIDSLIR